MKNITVIIITVLLLIIQTTVTPFIKIGWINFQLGITGIIVVSLIFKPGLAYANAIITGFFCDIFAGKFIGYYTFVYVLAVFLLILISKLMYKKSVFASMLMTFFMTILVEFGTYWLFFFTRGREYNTFVLSKIIIPQAFLNCIVAILIFLIYNFIYNKLDFSEDRW